MTISCNRRNQQSRRNKRKRDLTKQKKEPIKHKKRTNKWSRLYWCSRRWRSQWTRASIMVSKLLNSRSGASEQPHYRALTQTLKDHVVSTISYFCTLGPTHANNNCRIEYMWCRTSCNNVSKLLLSSSLLVCWCITIEVSKLPNNSSKCCAFRVDKLNWFWSWETEVPVAVDLINL